MRDFFLMGSDADRPFTLPTGTVAFLLTDIEGSSSRWETDPASMAPAVTRHYAILDEAVARHGGVRPVEQGEGDSIVAAFSRATDAIAAALDAQRELLAEVGDRFRVRMAVHAGEAQMRDEGNYFGQAVIRHPAPGYEPSATADRCSCLAPLPISASTRCRMVLTCSIWARCDCATSAVVSTCANYATRSCRPSSRRCADPSRRPTTCPHR
jgi:hypothetical protein